ncbi:cytochrome C [Dissulfurirhabdus thermomarina]|uniref:Cytochrome C n=1 Tax=Dissulfurirhabdus thermomarina TaxID=1765737 RepID=A0A6N9TJH9_DISTH|nr:cytochrome c3 family protein [Dissulfurirhabdus thermomarina]NDY41412.1 cytochrome C [Dissulfurirhabdus thermomarina]NMX24400.1 cytochrome C [Dissulfurirhabdus thermomarina]
MLLLGVLGIGMLAAACDPVTRHEVLSTVFDGVPELPPAEEMCEAYARRKVAEALAPPKSEAGEAAKPAERRSSHRPYAEKRCTDCHDFSTRVGLLHPRTELCFTCHKGFVRGPFVHGPVAVGDCLACHLPHTSPNPALLREDRTAICQRCHREERLAAALHRKVVEHGMNCVDCHDPHYGDARYFLR